MVPGTPYDPPTNLTAVAGPLQVSLSFTPPSGAYVYTLKRSLTTGGPYTTVGCAYIGATTYVDTGLSAGVIYYYVATAGDGNTTDESGNSNEASASPTPAPPAAPTNLNATASQGQVSLSWTASSGATSYNVYGGSNYYQPPLLGSTTSTSYAATGLSASTSYYFQVTAVSDAGEGSPSSMAYATTPQAPFSAPVTLTATAGPLQVSLSWEYVSNCYMYNVKRSTTAGGPYTAVTTVQMGNSCTDTGLTAGTTYYYVVTATDYTGTLESTNSPESSATPTAAPPAAPTNLNATASQGQVSLSWTTSAGATSYNVYGGSNYYALPLLGSTTNTSYTATGLSPNTYYYFQISAVSGAGEGPQSYMAYSMTPQGPLSPPTDLTASAGAGQISLSWNGNGAYQFNIKRATVTGGPYTTVTSVYYSTSYTDTGLTPGTEYFYVVTAMDGMGGNESGNSNEASGAPAAAPPASPTNLNATSGNAQVSLTWTGSTGATSYNLKRSTYYAGPFTTIASPTDTSYTDSTASNGTYYYYEVSALNANGESANSGYAYAEPQGPPPAPTGLSATAGAGSVNLSWSGNGSYQFNIKRALVSGGPYTTIASVYYSTSYTDSNLSAGTYFYVVSALNGVESQNSSEASATA